MIMKKIFGELINLLAASLLILCLLTSGYLIFANVYHAKLLSYNYKFTNAEIDEHKKFVENVDKTSTLVEEIDFGNISDPDGRIYYKYINLALQKCIAGYKDSTYYKAENSISTKENYDLYNDFNKAHNECYSYQLSTIEDMIAKSNYKDKQVESYIREFRNNSTVIAGSTDLIQGVLYGNSSYQFYTFETMNTIYNQTKAVFYQLRNNYQLEVDMVNTLANYLDNVAKGVSNEKDN